MGYMEIHPVGRWQYELSYCPDDRELWMATEGPTVWGLARARRRAARDLRRLEREPRAVVAVVR